MASVTSAFRPYRGNPYPRLFRRRDLGVVAGRAVAHGAGARHGARLVRVQRLYPRQLFVVTSNKGWLGYLSKPTLHRPQPQAPRPHHRVARHGLGGLGLVAAGTWTRWVGLYDFAQAGDCVAAWGSAVDRTAERGHSPGVGIGGNGVTQTVWSPCGRYLLVAERKSRGILVYDVRVTGELLGAAPFPSGSCSSCSRLPSTAHTAASR
ncbi:wd repeat-containing protein [Apiospora phragmitis]|uniref:Wd repeat-containing protein n=1 Tax=Apiospora phragmitis TaxID=2905665 RepID=A0ABR1VBY1_9PEZI